MKVGDIEVHVRRSKRKTMSIFVERDGSVSALVPDKLSDAEIVDVLNSKEYLINKYLAEWKELNHNKVDREYVNGQSYLYLGRNYRLKIVHKKLIDLTLKDGYFLLAKDKLGSAKDQFTQFYKRKLKDKILPMIEKHQSTLGVKVNRVKIMELQNRWGSCTASGNINFHWKCAMAPTDVIDYIVAHELVHLIHPNHSKDFWNDLDKLIPNYQKHIEWLREHGAGMSL